MVAWRKDARPLDRIPVAAGTPGWQTKGHLVTCVIVLLIISGVHVDGHTGEVHRRTCVVQS